MIASMSMIWMSVMGVLGVGYWVLSVVGDKLFFSGADFLGIGFKPVCAGVSCMISIAGRKKNMMATLTTEKPQKLVMMIAMREVKAGRVRFVFGIWYLVSGMIGNW